MGTADSKVPALHALLHTNQPLSQSVLNPVCNFEMWFPQVKPGDTVQQHRSRNFSFRIQRCVIDTKEACISATVLKKREWHGALKRSKGKEKIGAAGVFIFEKLNFVPESRSRQRVTGAVEPESLGRRVSGYNFMA
ncbi:predicted protein [Coccidioides posadasii str. Silveira]|uniref:Predicted protein n=1 Tax=Coccidioides posadasii (strain RMSCC 757 / Silveira) TaxID=443226 RepID=E9DEH2_COCPS|nr:predicted protein [Coccidioides posadasii str. Silveira]